MAQPPPPPAPSRTRGSRTPTRAGPGSGAGSGAGRARQAGNDEVREALPHAAGSRDAVSSRREDARGSRTPRSRAAAPQATDGLDAQRPRQRDRRVRPTASSGGEPHENGKADVAALSASSLARELKRGSEELERALHSLPPWTHGVEEVRKRLRTTHLSLLLAHPSSTYAQSLDYMWLSTTHGVIRAYRSQVAAAEERVVALGGAVDAGPTTKARPSRRRKDERGSAKQTPAQEEAAADLRKVLTRFRAFLAGETRTYQVFIARFVRAFGLVEVPPSNTSGAADGSGESAVGGWLKAAGVSLAVDAGPETGAAQIGDGSGSSADDSLPAIPAPASAPPVATRPHVLSPEERAKKVGLVHKALICLGDLARYAEQYGAERERREKGRAALGKKGTPRERERETERERYADAKRYYEVARGLMPENGNPWNQLALVAATTGDTLTSIYSYLRALTVAQPFNSAEGNLARTYARVLAEWRAKPQRARGGVAEIDEGREVVVLKEDMLVLQGSLYLGEEIENIASLVAFHRENLRYTILSRLVPTETLIKALVCSIAGHWQSRLGKAAAAYGSAAAHQKIWLEYILLMAGILLECASEEVAEVLAADTSNGHDSAVADGDDEDDRLHTKISAVVRRLLPSLRIFSKWLKSNQDVLTAPLDSQNPSRLSANSTTQQTVDRFWDTYLDFLTRLETLFPLEKLPMLSEPLEEDFDMRGFAPLKRGMMEKRANTGAAAATAGHDGQTGSLDPDDRNGLHPNDEQLMRISDLLVDGKMLVQMDSTGRFRTRPNPFTAKVLNGTLNPRAAQFTSRTFLEAQTPVARHAVLIPRVASDTAEDDGDSVSTETEDDPVNLAMRATMADGSSLASDEEESALDGIDEDDEEEIVWGRSLAAPAQALASNQRAPARPSASTAEDLLASLMLGSTPMPSARTSRQPSAFAIDPSAATGQNTSPNLLFGSPAAAVGSSPSIWSRGFGDLSGASPGGISRLQGRDQIHASPALGIASPDDPWHTIREGALQPAVGRQLGPGPWGSADRAVPPPIGTIGDSGASVQNTDAFSPFGS